LGMASPAQSETVVSISSTVRKKERKRRVINSLQAG
jgi:hypothetical protein